MKIAMTQTNEFLIIDGVRTRTWRGFTPMGVPCLVYVARIAVPDGVDQKEFALELEGADAPAHFNENVAKRLLAGLALVLALLLGIPARGAGQERRPSIVPVLVLTAAAAGAGALDVGATLRCTGPSCAEGNPIAAPLFYARRPELLVAGEVLVVAGVGILGRRMQTSSCASVRRWWWAPAALFTLGSLIAWQHNEAFLRAHP